MFTPPLQLETLFVLDADGCIVSTREPNASTGSAFFLVRDQQACAWAVHRDVPADQARELGALARSEPPLQDLTDAPVCARRSPTAAEAGLETAASFRDRGCGARVVAAWERMIIDSGRLPLYSTSWDNVASLGVARRAELRPCASNWSLYR